MNVAFVCNEYPPARGGGIGTAVRALARGLVAQGHRAIVVGLYHDASVEDDDGVTVYRLAFPMQNFLWRSLASRRFLHRQLQPLVRRHRIDIVEWPDFQGMFHAPAEGAVDVVRLHGTSLNERERGLMRPNPLSQPVWEHFERHILHSVPHWIGVSHWYLEASKQRFGLVPQTEAVVPNGVDAACFFPPTSDTGRRDQVFYAGAYRTRKGVRTLVQAAEQAWSQGAVFDLLLMGYEADCTRDALRALAPRFGHRVTFAPFGGQHAVAEQMRRSRVFAMPSHHETCGNGWLEAAMCGTPVIGSTAACGPEMVTNGRHGWVVDPDDVQATANAIQRLLGDTPGWQAMSAALRAEASERFGLPVCVQQSLRFYADCLRGHAEVLR